MGEYRRTMKWSPVVVLALSISGLLGCASDADVICDKIDECNFNALIPGVSMDECVELLEKNATDSQRETCANCVKDKSCQSIASGACNAECGFL